MFAIINSKSQSFSQCSFLIIKNSTNGRRIVNNKFMAPPERCGDAHKLKSISLEKIVDKITANIKRPKNQNIFLLFLYFSIILCQNSFSDIACHKKSRSIKEKITLKAIILPHSGGKKNGWNAHKGRERIIKKLAK